MPEQAADALEWRDVARRGRGGGLMQGMPYGLAVTIDQQALALAQGGDRIEALERENTELRAQLSSPPPD
ncbi:hypothetical protein NOK12_12330 [Nocardioides sp. OK12]|nr:hypothetical protein NOK12_12330 [Nocardioides sp. OK12]